MIHLESAQRPPCCQFRVVLTQRGGEGGRSLLLGVLHFYADCWLLPHKNTLPQAITQASKLFLTSPCLGEPRLLILPKIKKKKKYSDLLICTQKLESEEVN